MGDEIEHATRVPAGGLARQDVQAFELALVSGDLSKLTPEERLSYYKSTCQSLGLNPLTKPFDYIHLNGKLVLYARRDCTDQLRKIHRVDLCIVGREKVGDLYVVTARAETRDGRRDESIGAVHIGTKRGEDLANGLMKAETKAKRRVTLSICGLGVLDETEVGDDGAGGGFMQTQNTPPIPTVLEDNAHEKLIEAFDSIGVTAAELRQYLGHDVATVTPKEWAELRAVFTAIRDGEAKWAELLEHRLKEAKKPKTLEDLTRRESPSNG